MGTRAAALVLALSASAPLLASADEGSDSEQFTADELSRLEHGLLVERRVTQLRGDLRLMGGTSWQLIDAPPDAVWTALLDTAHYTRILPQLMEARVVADQGDRRTLYLRHGNRIAAASYYLSVQFDRARHDIAFRVDESRPRGIRAAWGFYALRAYPGGRSLLVYGVMADIGDGLLNALLRPSIHEWLMKVPWLVKRFVESATLRASR